MANRTDNFNRANNASSLGTPSDAGSNWVTVAATWGIFSNAAYAPSSGGSAYLESSLSDCDVQLTVPVVADGAIAARIVDFTTYEECLYCGIKSDGLRLYEKTFGGGFSLIGSHTTSGVSNGDTIKVTCNGTAITVYQNGVSRISVTSSLNTTATKHGLYAFDSTARFDDFSIMALGGGSTASPHYYNMQQAILTARA